MKALGEYVSVDLLLIRIAHPLCLNSDIQASHLIKAENNNNTLVRELLHTWHRTLVGLTKIADSVFFRKR